MVIEKYKISVVIISYNQGNYLEETIESVISQSYSNKEIILIDGGSSDNSKDIIKKYQNDFSFWVSEKDDGQTDAIKKGFNKCSGDIIGWINSDDIIFPNALQYIANKANNVGTCDGVFYGGFYFIDSQSKKQEKFKSHRFNYFIAKTLGPTISQPGSFWGKKIYDEIGGLNDTFHYGMDLDLFCNFLFNGYPFYYTGKFHSGFRKHETQKGHSLKYLELCNRDFKIIQERYNYNRVPKSKKWIARFLQILIRLFTGYYFGVVLFRLKTRKSFRKYATEYTE